MPRSVRDFIDSGLASDLQRLENAYNTSYNQGSFQAKHPVLGTLLGGAIGSGLGYGISQLGNQRYQDNPYYQSNQSTPGVLSSIFGLAGGLAAGKLEADRKQRLFNNYGFNRTKTLEQYAAFQNMAVPEILRERLESIGQAYGTQIPGNDLPVNSLDELKYYIDLAAANHDPSNSEALQRIQDAYNQGAGNIIPGSTLPNSSNGRTILGAGVRQVDNLPISSGVMSPDMAKANLQYQAQAFGRGTKAAPGLQKLPLEKEKLQAQILQIRQQTQKLIGEGKLTQAKIFAENALGNLRNRTNPNLRGGSTSLDALLYRNLDPQSQEQLQNNFVQNRYKANSSGGKDQTDSLMKEQQSVLKTLYNKKSSQPEKDQAMRRLQYLNSKLNASNYNNQPITTKEGFLQRIGGQ